MPIASLFASNLGLLAPAEVVRPLTLSVMGVLLLFGLLRLVVREWHIAGFLSTGIVLGFFSYGHTYIFTLAVTHTILDLLLRNVSIAALKLLLHPLLVSSWIASLGFAIRLALRHRAHWQSLTMALNGLGVVLLLVPVGQILISELQLRGVRSASSAETLVAASVTEQSGFRPDIYYFVLDGYGSEAILDEIYDHDNSEFLQLLASQGFYVAPGSRSNYSLTILSLTSSMNMGYLDRFIESGQVKQVNELIPLLRQSELRTFLEREGYSVVSFSSGYFRTTIPDSDLFLEPKLAGAKDLEALLIQTTALLVVQDAASRLGLRFPYPGYDAHRQRILFTLQMLPTMVEVPGPKFVFVHILIPHPPFVFDRAGEARTFDRNYTIGDGSDFPGTNAEYVMGYRDQVRYINRRLAEILPVIISESPLDPVIVIQGDHGPGSSLDWNSPEASDLRERFSILNAFRLPGVEPDMLYPTITPVNTFRVILNSYFGADLPQLPDQSFFSSPKQPLDFAPLGQ